MGLTTLVSSLVAYAAGSALGGLALLLEVWLARTPFTWPAAAAYSLVGGLACGGSRALLTWWLGVAAARVAATGTLVGFASLHLLYFVNVKLLPGEHYLGGKSLAFDAAVLTATAGLAWVLVHSPRVRTTRTRWGGAVAASGAALFAGGLAILIPAGRDVEAVSSRDGGGPNLLLIVMDSVRRDRLRLDGGDHPAAPSLHSLARQGRTYTAAWAGSSWTVPSVAQMLGAGADVSRPPGGLLMERLASKGYVSACFTDNPHVSAGSDLTRGFDVVERSVGRWRLVLRRTVLGEVIERLDPGADHRLAEKVIRWATRQRGPFFAYVHLMDSHTPYRFPPLDGKRRNGRRIEFPLTGMPMSAEEAEDIEARYDGGVRSADSEVGRILAAAAGWTRPFVAIVTSDHGESLGEQGRWFHGQTLAPELLAIPLVLLGDGVVPGRANINVGHLSVLSTLLSAAGIGCPECGRNDLRSQLGPVIVEGGLPPDLAYRISGRYKLVLDLHSQQRRMFDLRADAEERRNLAIDLPDVAQALANGLSEPSAAPPPPPESLERLRALGYAGS